MFTLRSFRRAVVAYLVYAVIHVMFDSTLVGAQPVDAMDLRSAAVHSSPASVADWRPTVAIEKLTFDPRAGLSFQAAVPDSWNFHVPGWGDPKLTDEQKAGCSVPGVDNGCVQYTVWAVANVGGTWHAAGYIQMWKGRPSTGAPLPSDWVNWGGDARGIFGPELLGYRPAPGDRMGFLLTAGNGRLVGDNPLHERSNVVVVPLPAGDAGVFEFGGGGQAGESVHDTLVRVRAKYPAVIDGKQGAAILNEVAWLHRAEGWALLGKAGGNNCPQPQTGKRISCDYLIVNRGGTWFGQDVLVAAPGENEQSPANPVGDVNPQDDMSGAINGGSRSVVQAVDPGGIEPPPPPPPAGGVTKADLDLLRADLANQIASLRQTLNAVSGEVAGANEGVANVNQALADQVRAINEAIAALGGRIDATAPPTGCKAWLNLGATKIGIHCELTK